MDDVRYVLRRSRNTNLNEDGRDVGRGMVKGGAGVADEDANELDACSISPEGAKEGWCFSVFLVSLSRQPRSMQKPISKRMREQFLRSKDSRSGVGSAGAPRA